MPSIHTQHKPIIQNARQNIVKDPFFALPPVESFTGLFNVVNQSYFTYFDESLLDSQENSLVMRRDGLVHELLRHRQTPVVCLPLHVTVDDADDPRQKSIADILTKIVKDIPRLKTVMINLLEAIFYGKYAVETALGPRKVGGNVFNSIVRSTPINGDKIRYKWDGTPGIAIRSGAGATTRTPNLHS